MDAANDESVQTICLMFASQTGKTEAVNNIAGYFIHSDPSPILVVQPTSEFAESWSKERLVPMLRDCRCFDGLVRDTRSRDSGNTILHKSFPGGNIAIVGANAPSGLAGRPRRVVLLDEVDRFPASAGTEGDPCSLAIRRTESFWNSVIVLTSTPTNQGTSRIEKEFEQTDKRYWFCPCPHCGEFQTLKWAHVKWPEDKPEEAFYACEKCLQPWNDEQRLHAVKAGEWRPTAPFKGKRGYHLNGIASPFKAKRGYRSRLHQMAAQFLEAKAGGRETIKTWVNTFLSETFVEGEKVDAQDINTRGEKYSTEVPDGVLVLTWAADVQGDRIEAEIVGWGAGEESWGIKRGYFYGDPNKSSEPWDKLLEFISQEFETKFGKLKCEIGCCDSAFATVAAYKFARRCQPMRVFAVRGSPSRLKSVVERPKSMVSQALLIDTGEFKSIIYSRLKITEPGPRYLHFPDFYEDEFYNQLTAEEFRRVWKKGLPHTEWVNVRPNKRNEALDIRVYNHAALHLLNVNWERLAANRQKSFPAETPAPALPVTEKTLEPSRTTFRPPRLGGGFVNRWK